MGNPARDCPFRLFGMRFFYAPSGAGKKLALVQLRAGGDVRIDHQQMELFLAVFVMHG